MIKNLKFQIKNYIVGLSPMDGVTDEPFRLTQCHIAKPDLIFTEFVSAEGISRGGVKLYDQLLYSDSERPIIGQLFGKDPDSFYKAGVILCHLGFDGIDINMGCPAKTVTHHGSGAALIGQPELASAIIKAVKSAVSDFSKGKVTINDLKLNQKTIEVINRNLKYSDYRLQITGYQLPSVSVKTRLGLDTPVIDTWLPFLLEHQLDFLTLHGRTLKQGYSGEANWDLIGEAGKLAKTFATPLFGNGDLQTKQQALDYCQKYNLSGALIGRSAMGNPWAFSDLIPSWEDRFSAMVFHAHKFQEVFPTRRLDCLRHHFLLYVSGHPCAKSLRSQIIKFNQVSDLYSLESDLLSS
ncbi:MAG: tRNA-dihydrouridine synthase family protein [Candidatus Shapirobacteria bacterium]